MPPTDKKFLLFIYFLTPIPNEEQTLTNYRATRKWLAGLMPSARSTWRALQGSWLLSVENSTEQTVEFLSEEGWIPESKQEDPDFHHTCNSILLMAEPYDFHFKNDETEAL